MKKRQQLEKLYHEYNDVGTPDKDFNPARNKAVIKDTIEQAEKYHKSVHSIIDDQLGERIEAVASYGTYRFNRGTKAPEDYFGRRLWESFIGEKLLQKIRVMDSVNKLNRNGKFKKFISL